ncbi:DUF4539 domain containing protein [Trichuris trichiura]|uniref:DUF4539 domain containing protein n=1 Tax=Trichuris trichiura TaxID=36087 RepID=A0A077ZCI7_TRITR|nr:DUF4539 domain containing protein [Trichuris trichiura]
MEPWLSALNEIAYLLDEDRVSIRDIRKKCLVGPMTLVNVRYMIVLVACIREKFESGRSMVIEDESGCMDCILKVPAVDGPHEYLTNLSAGAVLLLNQPFFCCLSRLKPYMILRKFMIKRIYWLEYQNYPSSADVELLATQLLRTQKARPTVLQCSPQSSERSKPILVDEENLRDQLKNGILRMVQKDLEVIELRLSGTTS